MPDMCVNLDVHTRAINCPCLISGTSYYAPGNSFQTYWMQCDENHYKLVTTCLITTLCQFFSYCQGYVQNCYSITQKIQLIFVILPHNTQTFCLFGKQHRIKLVPRLYHQCTVPLINLVPLASVAVLNLPSRWASLQSSLSPIRPEAHVQPQHLESSIETNNLQLPSHDVSNTR